MSFNRWNYTDSNPVNRIDPSGNCWVEYQGDFIWVPADGYPFCYGRSNESEPAYTAGMTEGELINFHPSNDPPRENQVREWADSPYGGAMLSDVYQAMCDDGDAWWNAGPKFDLETFVGLMIMQESSFRWADATEGSDDTSINEYSQEQAKYITQVVATVLKYGDHVPEHQSWTCPPGTSGACVSGLFNFWAGHSEVARDWIKDYYHFIQDNDGTSIDGKLDGHYTGGVGDVSTNRWKKNQRFWAVFTQARLHGFNALHNPAYAIPYGPIMYGNNTAWTYELPRPNPKHPQKVTPGYHGIGKQTVYYYWDTFIVYTASQYSYWHGAIGDKVNQKDPSPSQ